MGKRRINFFPCLICGVDSRPILTFLLWTIGSLVLATIIWGLWAWGTGRLQNSEEVADTPLRAEEEETNYAR